VIGGYLWPYRSRLHWCSWGCCEFFALLSCWQQLRTRGFATVATTIGPAILRLTCASLFFISGHLSVIYKKTSCALIGFVASFFMPIRAFLLRGVPLLLCMLYVSQHGRTSSSLFCVLHSALLVWLLCSTKVTRTTISKWQATTTTKTTRWHLIVFVVACTSLDLQGCCCCAGLSGCHSCKSINGKCSKQVLQLLESKHARNFAGTLGFGGRF